MFIHLEEIIRFCVISSLCSLVFPLPLSYYYEKKQQTSSVLRKNGIISLVFLHPMMFSLVRFLSHFFMNIGYESFYQNKVKDFYMIFVAAIIQDFLFYITHRTMHLNKHLYKYHKKHHQEVETCVWSTFKASLVEVLLCNCFTMVVPCVFCQLGYVSFGIFQASLLSQAIRGHIVPTGKVENNSNLMSVEFHNLHHKKGNVNYGGFHLVIWDKIFGTFCETG